ELSSPGVAPEPTSATPQLQVIKRTGQAVAYDARKIAIAITKAFLAVEGQTASGSARVRETVENLARDITARIRHRLPDGGTIHIEEIQDLVELGLMRQGFQKIARAYVLYREEHAKQRPLPTADLNHPEIKVLRADGTEAPLNLGRLQTLVDDACHGLDGVDAKRVLEASLKNLYSGVKAKDVNTALTMAARPLIEEEPNYSYVSARLLLDGLRTEALSFLGVATEATEREMAELYQATFAAAIHRCIELALLSPALARFDLNRLGHALQPQRDRQFTYLGLQTLYDRYFLHWQGTRLELPQVFF